MAVVDESYASRPSAERIVLWLREAAAELEKCHAVLDAYGVARTVNGTELTLAARVHASMRRGPTERVFPPLVEVTVSEKGR